MTLIEIYKQVEEFILHTIPAEEQELWEKAELTVAIQPNTTSISGSYSIAGQDKPLDIRDKQRNRLYIELLRKLHYITAQGGVTKWNKAHFTISPHTKLKADFLWDQEWQNAEDDAAAEVQKQDSGYVVPRWRWEV